MKENTNSKFSKGLCRAAIAVIAIGIATAPIVHAEPNSIKTAGKPVGKIVLVRPADLPESARQTGEAMLLHETGDGRTLLYIEQNQGARLAIFDVTDPANIKGKNSVQLDASGPFDFVSSLGDRAELVRFRNGQGEAVLDLHKAKDPTIDKIQGLKFQGSTERLGDDGFMTANQASVQSDANAQDYQVVEIANKQEPNRVYDVNQVREEITNYETGTTFLLTADGLNVVRRPAVEEEHKLHEMQIQTYY